LVPEDLLGGRDSGRRMGFVGEGRSRETNVWTSLVLGRSKGSGKGKLGGGGKIKEHTGQGQNGGGEESPRE